MARAATQLNITQPAVSKAIAEMERTLGVRLLDRSRQGIEPTPYGRALLKRGAAIFDELWQGVREIEFLSDPAAGEVRISTSEPFAAGLLPIVIARLSQRYPRVSIYVTQSPIATLQHGQPRYVELRERNVDLVLGPIVISNSDDDIEAEPLFEEHLVVTAGLCNPWARRRRVELADLIDEPWSLQPADTIAGARSVEAFRACGLDVPRGKLISTSILIAGRVGCGAPFSVNVSALPCLVWWQTLFDQSLAHQIVGRTEAYRDRDSQRTEPSAQLRKSSCKRHAKSYLRCGQRMDCKYRRLSADGPKQRF